MTQGGMKAIHLILIISCLCPAYQEERSVLDKFVPILRAFKTVYNSAWERVSYGRQTRNMLALERKLQRNPVNLTFPCDLNITLRSKERPTSAHRLRPGDIDVIGAIGDSLTAGYAVEANNVLAINYEGRGSSFSIGGQDTWETRLTLPNILKNYNPHIYGYSLNSISTDRKSKFNVAEGGAISANMPYMARVLVKRIKNDRNVDLAKDWKMITVFIGHNDFCSENCYKKDFNKVLQDHKNDMLDVLRLFRDTLPRTVINFLPPIHLRILFNMTDKPKFCEITHRVYCPCLIGLEYRNLRSKMMELMTRWQQLDLEIAHYQEFDKEDFTIIAHNFTFNFYLPHLSDGSFDYGYVAPDCFHGSQRSHAKTANDLWNSLLEPYGQKNVEIQSEFERFLCPSDTRPYIFTRRNSYASPSQDKNLA